MVSVLGRRLMQAATCLSLFVGWDCALAPAVAAGQPPATPADFCPPSPVRTDAMDNPSKHAWDLFATLVQPAVATDPKSRGVPDCSRRPGAPGTTSVWETWKLADSEVFKDDGSYPADWTDANDERHLFGQAPGQQPGFHEQAALSARFNTSGEGVYIGSVGGLGETYMNKATFDFIRTNCLYSRDGLARYAKAVLDKAVGPITFPPESIEVKAAWVQFTDAEIGSGVPNNFYSIVLYVKNGQLSSGQSTGATKVVFGLQTLHILTKDVPNWFWATFHHKIFAGKPLPSQPGREYPDTAQMPASLAGTVWENYKLGGTQVNFVDTTGSPIVLSDAHIENGFVNSSCISCHSYGGWDKKAASPRFFNPLNTGLFQIGLPNQEPVPDGAVLAKSVDGTLVPWPGFPSANLQVTRNNVFDDFVQTDFVMSIPFRAKPETAGPPPASCPFQK
ncbi:MULTISPECIES: hypothetical protein [Mesorhizobium]|uniref:hypothetical protein n=1 Tax=Mesorhizobium TaxID=68287 RepID=UPI000B0A2919|nr:MULTISPECIES: hypothetical protein [Mesorhizobium]TPJ43846.1 hypothetical protein FJ437_19370 [Mesorhizobium sp. B2-6-6]MCA0002173.1 hypothetical protein [Mesorhizobium sp. B264B2A]MCA0008874.1 hypothetical protein [Mesorhizobium sp. B264B1B]MCA0015405.1 hypothetical protein [Mesorhizobium sp. B294B1A1]MCA0020363.1 hypothetical protein [Mesorhizobium sp. B264B1A]